MSVLDRSFMKMLSALGCSRKRAWCSSTIIDSSHLLCICCGLLDGKRPIWSGKSRGMEVGCPASPGASPEKCMALRVTRSMPPTTMRCVTSWHSTVCNTYAASGHLVCMLPTRFPSASPLCGAVIVARYASSQASGRYASVALPDFKVFICARHVQMRVGLADIKWLHHFCSRQHADC